MFRSGLILLLLIAGVGAAALLGLIRQGYQALELSAGLHHVPVDAGQELTDLAQRLSTSVRIVMRDRRVEGRENGSGVTPTGTRPSSPTQLKQPSSGRSRAMHAGSGSVGRTDEQRAEGSIRRWVVRLEEGEYGKSSDSAKEKVVEKALRELADWVRVETRIGRHIDAHLLLPADLLRQHSWVVDRPAIHLIHTVPAGSEQIPLYGAELTIELLPELRDLLVSHALAQQSRHRQALVLERSWLVGRGVVSVVILAGGLLVYCLLDDRTRGYYSRPLSAAISAGTVFVIAGLWLLPLVRR